MSKMSGRGHKRQLVEQQARTAADVVASLDKWRDLAYRQSITIRELEDQLNRWRNIANQLVNGAERQIDDLGGPNPMNEHWQRAWRLYDKAVGNRRDDFCCDTPRPDGFTYHPNVTVCDRCKTKFPYYDCYCELEHECKPTTMEVPA